MKKNQEEKKDETNYEDLIDIQIKGTLIKSNKQPTPTKEIEKDQKQDEKSIQNLNTDQIKEKSVQNLNTDQVKEEKKEIIEENIPKEDKKEIQLIEQKGSKISVYILLLILLVGIGLQLLLYNLNKERCIIRLKNLSKRDITDKILVNSLRLASNEDRNEPIRLLFSGMSDQEMMNVTKEIYQQLSSKCKDQEWEYTDLNEYHPYLWGKTIYQQIKKNPFSFFVMNINNVDYEEYEFLKDVFDGENASVKYEDDYISPRNAIFILISDLGVDDFSYVNPSENFFEMEDSLKKVIKRALKRRGWADRLIHRISRLVPFYK